MQTRAHLDTLLPYVSVEPFEVLSSRLGRKTEKIIKLDANENPYGPLSIIKETFAAFPFFHIYPDSDCRLLRQALSEFTGISPNFLLVGAGADELIDLLLRVLVEPGNCVVNCPPTFRMYEHNALLNGAYVVNVPRQTDFSIDLGLLKKTVTKYRPKLLFLCTPNNPDGSLLQNDVLDEILNLPTLVVLDEAYIEFADEEGNLGKKLSQISLVPERKNLAVLRTFSKWAGLAGLRVGFGAFPDWLMPILWKAKQPYNVNAAAIIAATLSLQNADELAKNVYAIIKERNRMVELLKNYPFLSTFPSRANFLLIRVKNILAIELYKRLMVDCGILVRYFDTPQLKDCIRISVGRPQDTDTLMYAFERIFQEVS